MEVEQEMENHESFDGVSDVNSQNTMTESTGSVLTAEEDFTVKSELRDDNDIDVREEDDVTDIRIIKEIKQEPFNVELESCKLEFVNGFLPNCLVSSTSAFYFPSSASSSFTPPSPSLSLSFFSLSSFLSLPLPFSVCLSLYFSPSLTL